MKGWSTSAAWEKVYPRVCVTLSEVEAFELEGALAFYAGSPSLVELRKALSDGLKSIPPDTLDLGDQSTILAWKEI